MIIIRGRKVYIEGTPVTPSAPVVTADDTANTLMFSAIGTIEVSENNGTWADYSGTINVGDVARAVGYWRARVKAAGINPSSAVTNSPAFTQGAAPVYDYEKYITNAYYAVNALNTSGQPVANGDLVQSIPDSISGNTVNYNGEATPSLGRPQFINGAIRILNQPNATFASSDVGWDTAISTSGVYDLPEEMTLVIRKLPSIQFEAMSGYPGDYYIAYTGDGGEMRIGSSTQNVSGSTAPGNFKVAIFHLLVESNLLTLWIDGVLAGTFPDTDPWGRKVAALSVHTNATSHDLIAKMYKSGKMTNTERADYFSQLNSKYSVGSLPNTLTQPYASNVTISTSGNNRTCNYTYNGINPENVVATQYLWYSRDSSGGGFVYTALGNTKTINYSGSNGLLVFVKVFDNQGNTWSFISN